MNQQVHEPNKGLGSLESLITEKSEEHREQDGSNGGSHPTDTTDAAEDRSDVPTVFDESPRGCHREVEIGDVEDQLMNGKGEHTQLQGIRYSEPSVFCLIWCPHGCLIMCFLLKTKVSLFSFLFSLFSFLFSLFSFSFLFSLSLFLSFSLSLFLSFSLSCQKSRNSSPPLSAKCKDSAFLDRLACVLSFGTTLPHWQVAATCLCKWLHT